MKRLLITTWFIIALWFGSYGQSNRAVHVQLNSERSSIYDSLFLANDWRKEFAIDALKSNKINLDSVYGNGWLNKMLKIGDQMPDINLGEVLNNPTNKTRFSDFKGKIVIFDFWATNCVACIAGFPKMAELQRKFGDKIQVILVNRGETYEEIQKRLGKNIDKIPKLLSVVNAKHLFPYFPSMTIPYHVWIDQKGIVRVLGSNFNTYEKKISELLAGKEIISLPTEATSPRFIPDLPYAKILGVNTKSEAYNSFFTSYNGNYEPKGTKIMGGSVINKIDPLTNNMRTTLINCTVRDMYAEAFRVPENKKVIFNPYAAGLFEVNDSTRYFFDNKLIDTSFIKSRFCYEQIYPKGISKEQAKRMMAEDLNTYFGKLYGTYGRLEKRVLSGYAIVRLPGEKYRDLYSKSEEYGAKPIVKNGKKYTRFQAIGFRGIFGETKFEEQLFYVEKKMLINESGIDLNAKIDLEIPLNASLSEIRETLKPYGLDIIEKNIEIELLVISDTKPK